MKNERRSGFLSRKMADYKISKKLLFGFMALAIVIVVILSFSTYAIVAGNDRLTSMYNSNVAAIDAVGKMREGFQQERALIRSMILFEPGSKSYDTTITQLSDAQAKTAIVYSDFEKAAHGDKELLKILSELRMYTTAPMMS